MEVDEPPENASGEDKATYVMACLYRNPVVAGKLRRYVRDNPESLRKFLKGFGRKGTVLQHAVMLRLPMKVIQFLADEYPESLDKTDEYGWHPLHCTRAADVANFFLKRNPKYLWIKTEEGPTIWPGHDALPVHHLVMGDRALDDDAFLATVQRWVELAPGSLKMANAFGYLPIHCAGTEDYAWEAPWATAVTKYLIQTYPASVAVKNKWGETPFHTALRMGLARMRNA